MRAPKPLLILIALIAVHYMFRFDFWNKDLIIRGDGYAYYGYIEGTLVHHDPFNELHDDFTEFGIPKAWMHEGIEGRFLPKMTMGVAYAWVPGFFVAHGVAWVFGYTMNGWTTPYQFAVGITAIIFLLMGCWSLYTLLSRRFSSWISALTVLFTYIGTNLLNYATVDPSMSHVYSFGLVALFLLVVDRWVIRPTTTRLFVAAFLLGWITLIRPTNIVVGLAVPLMLWAHRGSLKELLHWRLIGAAIVAALPLVPQLIFWNATTGEWLNYSYNQEAFYWTNPQILKGLFSYRNGWLLYTPIMAIALFGLIPLRTYDRGLARTGMVVLSLHVYITFCWWCWYYGGSLSIRPMIDVYAICAPGLAAAMAWMLSKGWVIRLPGTALMLVMLWNNFLQVDNFNYGYITDSTMTRTAYWATLLNPDPPKNLHVLGVYRDADTDRLRLGLPERMKHDTIVTQQLMFFDFQSLGEGAHMTEQDRFTEPASLSAEEIDLEPYELLEVIIAMESEDLDGADMHMVLSFDHHGNGVEYHSAEVSVLDLSSGPRHRLSFFLKEPANMPDDGELNIYGWMQGDGEVALLSAEVRAIKTQYSEPQ